MEKDIITLSLPAKAEYVLAARLTTSAISSRFGFDIDEIEDIKVAVAEACIALMNQKQSFKCINLRYEVSEELCIHVTGEGVLEVSSNGMEENDLSLYIIDSLMDFVEFHREEGMVREISMKKYLTR